MCLIDHKNKIIFIAVPKCASTSIKMFLKTELKKDSNNINSFNIQNQDRTKIQKHSTAEEISSLIENYSEYTSIAVIRNPFDWYVSWYTYRMREGSGYQTSNMTFKEYLEKQPMKELISFISDKNNNIIVDHIIRYEENIEEQFKKILTNIVSFPIEINIPKINISKKRAHKDYRKYYDDETRELVEKLQSVTLKKFGYKF